VLYLWLIILSVGDDVPVDSETLLMTNFMNLKIKPAQSFRCAHRDMVYAHVFIKINIYTCMIIYIYTMFKKKFADGLVQIKLLTHCRHHVAEVNQGAKR
jgi:hypothetical protein